MATHSSILAWEIPRTDELGKLQIQGVTKQLDTTWQLNNRISNRYFHINMDRSNAYTVARCAFYGSKTIWVCVCVCFRILLLILFLSYISFWWFYPRLSGLNVPVGDPVVTSEQLSLQKGHWLALTIRRKKILWNIFSKNLPWTSQRFVFPM